MSYVAFWSKPFRAMAIVFLFVKQWSYKQSPGCLWNLNGITLLSNTGDKCFSGMLFNAVLSVGP